MHRIAKNKHDGLPLQHTGGAKFTVSWALQRVAGHPPPFNPRIQIHIYSEPAGVLSDPIRIQYLTIIYGNWRARYRYSIYDQSNYNLQYDSGRYKYSV